MHGTDASSAAPRGSATRGAGSPARATPWQALRVLAQPRHLRRSLATAAIVGTLLFAFNQLDVIVEDGITAAVAIKGVLNYFIPFCVANVSILSASRTPARPPVPEAEDSRR